MKIKQLRHLLSVGEVLIKGRTDQAFLLRFLRAKKFDCEKAYRMVSTIPYICPKTIYHFNDLLYIIYIKPRHRKCIPKIIYILIFKLKQLTHGGYAKSSCGFVL